MPQSTATTTIVAGRWRQASLMLDRVMCATADVLWCIEHSLQCLSCPPCLSTPPMRLCVLLSTVILARAGFRVWRGKGRALMRRALLLRRVRAIVERWEGVFLDEVCTQCGEDLRRGRDDEARAEAFLRSVIGDDAAVRALRGRWCGEAAVTHSASARSMTGSFAFAADFALQDYLALCHAAEGVLRLEYDRHWLYRLQCIMRYAVFRRLAMMEEVRCYRACAQRIVLRHAACGSGGFGEAWRVYGRPSWLIPYHMTDKSAGASSTSSTGQQQRRHYLCLPWSYLPVESVMTCEAECSWLRDLVDHTLVPWRRESTAALRASAAIALRCTRTGEGARWSTVRTVWSRVDYWFLRYACPLVRHQVQERRRVTRAFITWHLLHAKPVGGALSSLAGFRVALAGLAAVHAADCVVQVFAPRLDVEAVLFGALSAGCDEAGAWGGPAALPSRLAGVLLRRLLLALLAEVATRTVRRLGPALLAAPLRARVAETLRRTLTAQVLHAVATADEAFLTRLVELGGPGSSETRPTSVFPPPSSSSARCGPRRSASLPPRHSVTHLVHEADYAAQLMLDYVHATVTWVTQLTCLLVMLYRHGGEGDWYLVPLSVLFLPFVEMRVVGWLAHGLGYGEDKHAERVVRALASATGACEEDTSTYTSLHGLRLLRSILAERAASSAVSRHGTRALASPCLALLVCSTIDTYGESYNTAMDDTTNSICAIQATRRLYAAVLQHPFILVPPQQPRWWRLSKQDDRTDASAQSIRAQHVVCAMRQSVECVLQTRLRDASAAFASRTQSVHHTNTSTTTGATLPDTHRTPELHPWLDETETRILQSPSALRCLPAPMDFCVLFAFPTRALLRHLGLEVVCGFRTAVAQCEGGAQHTRDKLAELLVRGVVVDPLERLVYGVVPCVRTLLLVAVLGTEWHADGLYVRPSLVVASSATLWSVVARLRGYAALMEGCGGVILSWCSRTTMDEYGMITLDTVRSVQQLCTALPTTISDAAPFSTQAAALVERRREWRTYLTRNEAHRSSLVFDKAGRVTGGLRMCDGLAMRHVYFAYPQLHHADGDSSAPRLQPTLIDCSLRLPAAQMTAIIGESGAGKSSLARLLTRLYDPLPLFAVDWTAPASSMTYDDKRGCEHWTEALLEHVVWLQYVEHPLPQPPSLASPPRPPLHDEAPCEARVMDSDGTRVVLRCGGVWFDELPLALLSVSYLRRWLLQLTQYTPAALLPAATVIDNVRFLDPDVSHDDALRAARLCECDAFVTRRHALGYDAAIGAAVSAGEGQRLLLARVLAAAVAHLRRECDGTAGQQQLGACAGLLLDEPTSRLDAENEVRVMRAVQDLTRCSGCSTMHCEGVAAKTVVPRLTVVIIAHRMSTLKEAQHMVVLEKGRVTAQGTPHEVCRTNAFAHTQRQLQALPTLARDSTLAS